MSRISLDPETIVVRSTEILGSEIEEQTVMMDVKNGNYYGLGETGSRIWQLIEKPISIAVLCDMLVGEFSVDPAQCLSDTVDFIATLADREIVTLS
ncbi:PqqD family peptide modification chaperone [Puniceicoccaceae bacterium K14]|nr:PqqD family peptide modification chaperone [Puniceicoccaceae bacterium K14]